MAFTDLVRGLKEAEHQLTKQLEGVRGAISVLRTHATPARVVVGRRASATTPVRRRRRLSAKARAAISRAQKLRWAKQRAAAK